jgi:exopolysaccharide production protein ExoQ
VSVAAPAWPRSGAPARAGVRSASAAMEIIAFALSVLMLLTFSQAWVMPVMGETVDPAASGLVRALFFPAYAAGLFLLAQRPGEAFRGIMGQPFLILLMAVVVASISWSVAPDQTIRRAVAIGFTTLSGVALAARWRWSRLTEVIAVSFAILAILSLATGLLLPSIGRMAAEFPNAWRGLWPEKNSFGGLMTWGFLAFAAAAMFTPRRALFWGSMAALALVLLVLSTSKTSLVALTLGVGALGFVVVVRRGGAVAVAACWLAVVALVALGAAIVLSPEVFFALLGKDATLTGRTKIWDAVIRLIQQRPWLGYGYGAVWSDTSTGWGPLSWIIKQAGFKPEHAHNSWLEQWLGLGLVGLGAWALFYLTTLFRAVWAVFRSPGALLVFPFLVVYTLISLTESIAVTYNDLRWVLFVALAVKLALPDQVRASRSAPSATVTTSQPPVSAASIRPFRA